MLVFCNRWSRTLIVTSVALLIPSMMMGQSRPLQPSPAENQKSGSMRPALTSEASSERVKDLLFATILTTCPVPGEGSPAVFFYDEMGLKVGRTGPKTLFEYRNTWTKLYPYPLREADRLNGIQ